MGNNQEPDELNKLIENAVDGDAKAQSELWHVLQWQGAINQTVSQIDAKVNRANHNTTVAIDKAETAKRLAEHTINHAQIALAGSVIACIISVTGFFF